MEPFIMCIITFLGLLGGIFLYRVNVDEMKNGKKYIIFIQKLLFIIIVGYFLYSLDMKITAIFLSLFSLSLFFVKDSIPTKYVYVVLGFVLLLFFNNSNNFVILSGLVFLFGIPSGTLIAFNKYKVKQIMYHLLFFIGPIIGVLI